MAGDNLSSLLMSHLRRLLNCMFMCVAKGDFFSFLWELDNRQARNR
jgi:hypothetical protein